MVDRKSIDGGRSPLVNGAILAIALALILGAHEVNRLPGWSVVGVYIYWFGRIGMSYLIIIGAYAALGQVMSGRSSPIAHAGLATALSFPPFVMVVTTLDLLIGDLALLRTDPNVLLNKLGIEAASLIDNHLTTCALLLAPYVLAVLRPESARVAAVATDRMMARTAPVTDGEAQPTDAAPYVEPEVPGLLLASQPPVQGELLAAEAQEHYVKLKATEQGGMSLYRFGDAVRDLARYQGMQVHRSHWIADAAVTAVIGKRGAMKIELISGEIIPVSRRYELEVEARYSNRERRPE
ncbi:MAG: LytTR family DNA-binding domain-containing protein [Pseudomonadota bacterium]